jgi:hypothetical protein
MVHDKVSITYVGTGLRLRCGLQVGSDSDTTAANVIKNSNFISNLYLMIIHLFAIKTGIDIDISTRPGIVDLKLDRFKFYMSLFHWFLVLALAANLALISHSLHGRPV